jgi:uncharacterized protein YodC (DUF2158 family)
MSDQQKISQRDDKYWIKPGVEVAHREYPDRKMIVDDVLKKTETVIDNGKEKPKTFVIGVECHWFDKSGRYDRGRFLTMELLPFGKKIQSVDPESFPKQIPTSALSEDVL